MVQDDTVIASQIHYLKDNVLREIIPMIRFFIDGFQRTKLSFEDILSIHLVQQM